MSSAIVGFIKTEDSSGEVPVTFDKFNKEFSVTPSSAASRSTPSIRRLLLGDSPGGGRGRFALAAIPTLCSS